MRVLIVEDEPATRHLLDTALSGWGFEAISTRNGVEGWQQLSGAAPPRLCVVDLNMPRMNGLELCRKIREHDPNRKTYVLILTVKDNPEEIKEGFEAGADDYATKPFDEAELRSRVQLGKRVIELERALNA